MCNSCELVIAFRGNNNLLQMSGLSADDRCTASKAEAHCRYFAAHSCEICGGTHTETLSPVEKCLLGCVIVIGSSGTRMLFSVGGGSKPFPVGHWTMAPPRQQRDPHAKITAEDIGCGLCLGWGRGRNRHHRQERRK